MRTRFKGLIGHLCEEVQLPSADTDQRLEGMKLSENLRNNLHRKSNWKCKNECGHWSICDED